MDIVVTEVKQIGRELILVGNSVIGYQHSANLYIKLTLDKSENNPFSDTVVSAYCRNWKSKIPVICPIEEREDGLYILLNHKVFEQEGDVYLSLGGINEERVVLTTNNLILQIDESNNFITDVSPSEKYWEIEVLNAMKAWYANVVEPVFHESEIKLNQLIRRSEEQEEKTEELQTKVEEQQIAVGEALEQSMDATAKANEAARAASIEADKAITATGSANSAAQEASDVVAEIERKLQAGEFIGPTGATGADGAKGDKGDPGSRILYGSGAPSASDGNVGDWYYDTGSELWDVYFKSSTGQWTKMGQLKSGGNVPNQNLIINGDFQVWQRGTTVDVAKRSGVTADRWYMSRNEAVRLKTTIKQDNGLCVTFTSAPTSGENVQFDYLVPQETAKEIAGQTVTLSYAGTGDIQVRVRVKNGDNYTDVVSKTKDTAVTFDVPTFTEGDILDVVVYTYSTATVNYVKLEPGSTATPLVPRYYSEELMECMRFYQRLTYSYSTYCSSLSTSMHDTLFLKMPMRSAPTITSLTSVPNNDSINVRSINYSYMTGGTLRLSVEPSATGFVRVYNVTIELEAELI